jgi:hypothetical protein
MVGGVAVEKNQPMLQRRRRNIGGHSVRWRLPRRRKPAVIACYLPRLEK